MRPKSKGFVWQSESALCAEFGALIPEGWTCYNETAGFDMIVVHDTTGAQIGVEAEQVLKIGNQKIRPEDLRGPLAVLGYSLELTRRAG